LINPHTSFFFRSELQMSSDEGLNAYGAVTWGQFFIYQGFNERAGWMHTSSGVDAVDEFLETVDRASWPLKYKYGSEERPFTTKTIAIRFKTTQGMLQKVFTAFYTSHGPVTHEDNGKWVTMKLMNIPIPALEQSYLRTKAHNYAEYKKTMALMANSSNNTIFADADGDIAYWHGNYIPKRDTKFDFTKPVDGSDPATDWHGLMALDEVPHLLNPKSGYLFNVNNAPWWGAGESSLKKSDYPAYVEMGNESARGLHAIMILKDTKDFTLDSLMTAAYDSYLPWFDQPLAALLKAWSDLPFGNPLMEPSLERGIPGDFPRRILGAGAAARARRRRPQGGHAGGAVRRLRSDRRAVDDGPQDGCGPTNELLWDVEDLLGRNQPLPASDQRHRATVQRCCA
jgi:acyl-homoserine lactone acylase PvdQ